MKKVFNVGMYYFNRKITGIRSREKISNLIKIFLPKMNPNINAEGVSEFANKVEEEGIVFLPRLLTPLQIEEIKSFLTDKKMHLNYDRNKTAFTREEIPKGAHVSSYFESDVLNCPHLLELANHPLVLSVLGKVMKCKPTLTSIKVWQSYPGHDTAKDSENFHRDLDNFQFLKLFVYLTDVDEGSGPHVYVKKSHKSSSFLRVGRFADEEIYNHFGEEKVLKIMGPEGSSIIENTFGIHKGQVAEKRGRLMFQAEYCLLPIGVYKYSPISINRTIDFADKYINRLFIK